MSLVAGIFVFFTDLSPMYRLSNAFLILFIFGFAFTLKAQHRFIENGGQWHEAVNYRADIPGGKFYIEKDRFTFDLYDVETADAVFASHGGNTDGIPVPEFLNCHAYQIRFDGANDMVLPSGKNPNPTAYSFFLGNDQAKWAGDLKSYNEVRYPQLYAGIDLKVYSKGTLKYDFIVRPDADPSVIKMVYEGVQPELNRKGQLLLKTSVGEVLESKPFAYQVIDGQIQVVKCTYHLSGNVISFDLESYDHSKELIIDPELIFSTYSGSFSDNFGYTATSDLNGHLYSGSSSFGTGYPFTTGAYQSAWAGGAGAGSLAGTDMAISKFNLEGTDLLYSTYLGGSGDELPHSLVADGDGVLYILGTTGSDNYPTTLGAFQTLFQGGTPTTLGGVGIDYSNGSDIVVSRLSPAGTILQASTLVGGTENDGTNTNTNLKNNYADEVRGEIELDADGNVLVGSCTFSVNFPMAANAWQPTKNSGQEGVVFKMNPTLTQLLASTFFGGGNGDAVYSINSTADGKITIGGGTHSTNLVTTANAYQPAYGGGDADGFIATFNSNLSALEASTYFGSGAYDQIYFVERDGDGNPHIYGQTEATDATLIFNAPYNVPNSGMLLAKFTPNLQDLTWSTVFGTGTNTPNLSPTAFSVDICNRIYLSGWGGIVNSQGSTTGMEVTSDAIKPTTDGNDFYFMVLSGDAAELTFATFFGGNQSAEHVDGGTSRFDRSGKIYQAVCAGCGSNDDFPIAPANALSSTNNSTNCNLGVAKIDFDLPLIMANFDVGDICQSESISFENTSGTFSAGEPTYQWLFGDGNTSAQVSPAHTYNNPGIYNVMLIATDLQTCNQADTAYATVEVYPAPELILPDELFSCTGNTFVITADSEGSASDFIFASDPGFNNPIDFGVVDSTLTYTTFSAVTIYVMSTNDFCETTGSVTIVPPPNLSLSIPDTLLCASEIFELSAILSAGSAVNEITWTPEALIISGQGTTGITINAVEPVTLEASVTTNFGCVTSAEVQIDVYPIFLEVPSDTLMCDDEPIVLMANSGGLAQNFQWSSNPDFTDQLNNPGDSAISVLPSVFTYFYIQVQNELCVLTDSVGVSLLSAGTSTSNDQYICAGDTAFVFVSNDFPGSSLVHTWEPEELIVSGQGTSFIQAIVTETTTFNVSSATPEGCIVENSATVVTSNLGNLQVEASADPENIVHDQQSIISVIPADSEYFYEWTPPTYLANPNATQTISSPEQTITYHITITDFDAGGFCAKSDSVTIFVFEAFCGKPNIFVPNAFSPNGDGENDVLYVRGGNITDLTLAIYDRWGNVVFETTDQTMGWDGTYKDDLAEPAVFVYHLDVRCGDGQTFTDKGNITLLR